MNDANLAYKHLLSRRALLAGAATTAGVFGFGLVAADAASATANKPVVLPPVTDAVTPFRVVVAAAEYTDLKARLVTTRFPEMETVNDWSQGVPLARMKSLVAYWHSSYDMRRLERRLNAVPQFRTKIDGLGIHFIHVRSRYPNATPIILTHGWPGSVVEFLKIIGPMTNPVAYGGRAEDAFHVVIPSLPGFGFSNKPSRRGWDLPRIAQAWAMLMKRLGYTHYIAQGGDFGAGVTTWMAKLHVSGLTGIHVNLPILFPPPVVGTPTDEEKASIAQLIAYDEDKAGYAKIRAHLDHRRRVLGVRLDRFLLRRLRAGRTRLIGQVPIMLLKAGPLP